ncbi:urease accessory protein UreE [Hoeflea sp. IMCC20628]|uniref:urease accessory protein UreE n=1 Tax=Hoeflea sp. IMCC20628 TaxID=1620421 RepID=UPI00063AAB14|nr:urease accessory protein UreE [Hoeflea sp. IMCC20628]AKI01589.1 urease accessory protein UreE [Hoeflea sp. IMCC20628]
MTLPTASSVTTDFDISAAIITLDETARHRRRMRMVSDRLDNGSTIAFLLDLPQARLLRHGDGLVLDDGRIIEVRAEPEALMEVRGRDARHLLSLAWQIGNRHLAAEITTETIRLRSDHVILDMLIGLGASVTDIEAPFDPEGGAYGGEHAGHHHDGHDHPHGPDHQGHSHD